MWLYSFLIRFQSVCNGSGTLACILHPKARIYQNGEKIFCNFSAARKFFFFLLNIFIELGITLFKLKYFRCFTHFFFFAVF